VIFFGSIVIYVPQTKPIFRSLLLSFCCDLEGLRIVCNCGIFTQFDLDHAIVVNRGCKYSEKHS
jgi:iron-sulfur cluster repair protein YtfE (RIC family)